MRNFKQRMTTCLPPIVGNVVWKNCSRATTDFRRRKWCYYQQKNYQRDEMLRTHFATANDGAIPNSSKTIRYAVSCSNDRYYIHRYVFSIRNWYAPFLYSLYMFALDTTNQCGELYAIRVFLIYCYLYDFDHHYDDRMSVLRQKRTIQ